jgi:sugar phosphate isomerase/epimerase
MKIGVFAVLFGQKPFEETLDYIVELGLGAIEIGTGRARQCARGARGRCS